jgi:hypothetical protein
MLNFNFIYEQSFILVLFYERISIENNFHAVNAAVHVQ